MDTSEVVRPSPFLHQSSYTEVDSLVILHLKRDAQYPLLLRERDDENKGYEEGKVVNTRFGSFPHSTLIGVPHGSQVGASCVDTGTRGRRVAGAVVAGQKRKRPLDSAANGSSQGDAESSPAPKAAVAAASGFGHILPPTPERWTASLPHRTQVVYPPDYNYILQRLRARPGAVIIEAGAGSGSFTHAAARAVFNGYPQASLEQSPQENRGRVWTFESVAERASQAQNDIKDHVLDSIVTVTHRDVYADGFCLPANGSSQQRVKASIVFLDLPAPWRALPHLDRDVDPSPLDPHKAIHLCTFSPCIEQVQRTVAVLRARGWVEIQMVELFARRIEARRERVGLQEEGLRGVNPNAATVDEALERLRFLEKRTRVFHQVEEGEFEPKQDRLQGIRDTLADRKLYKEGRLSHQSEMELKTHTSYLVFAILPIKWTESDEQQAAAGVKGLAGLQPAKKSRKQMKREAKAARMAAAAKGERDVEEKDEMEVEANGEVPDAEEG